MNRLDAVCTFRRLTGEDCERIAGLRLAELRDRAAGKGIDLEIPEGIYGRIRDAADYKRFGAREISRVIAEKIEGPLADIILAGGNGKVRVTEEGDEVMLKTAGMITEGAKSGK